MTPKRKRNITLDTNILVAWVLSKKEGSITRRVITKSITDDRLMLSDVICDECLGFAETKSGQKAKVTKEYIAARLDELNVNVIRISPVPSDDELKKMGYRIRDDEDLKILYSVSMTDSVTLVTRDDDFSGDVAGIKARIMDPESYLRDRRR